MNPRVALVTYSTKPRGGVVHTLSLADALRRVGVDVTVVALGRLGQGFFRPVDVPTVIVPAPEEAPTLEQRVFRSVDALSAGLAAVADDFDILHTQDCISARAAARVRDSGTGLPVIRTVHHVDDFTTEALVDCQRQAILEPDRILVVSRHWQALLMSEYGVDSSVVYNGVDGSRFASIDARQRADLRRRAGVDDGRALFLSVGGIEPRKGSVYLIEALGRVSAELGEDRPVLAVVGGHSFQDYAAYREEALARLPALGLELGRDVILLGTVSDDELRGWYGAADALAFPSIKEGWGLVVLEAMSAGLPVVATDIPVFREYLTDDRDALLVPPADPQALSEAMAKLAVDADLRSRLAAAGRQVAARFTWEATARAHAEIYREVAVKGDEVAPQSLSLARARPGVP